MGWRFNVLHDARKMTDLSATDCGGPPMRHSNKPTHTQAHIHTHAHWNIPMNAIDLGDSAMSCISLDISWRKVVRLETLLTSLRLVSKEEMPAGLKIRAHYALVNVFDSNTWTCKWRSRTFKSLKFGWKLAGECTSTTCTHTHTHT